MHDPCCDDLARHFLQDEPGPHDARYEARVERLAEAIQEAVETELQAMGADVVCQHGTAMDVHCCNCHHRFLFDAESCVCVFSDEPEVGEARPLRERTHS